MLFVVNQQKQDLCHLCNHDDIKALSHYQSFYFSIYFNRFMVDLFNKFPYGALRFVTCHDT